MLNEFKEYYDYTRDLKLKYSSPDQCKHRENIYGRLLLKTVQDRHGIGRVLTIIARRFLYHDIDDISKSSELSMVNKNDLILLARTAMEQWCSYDIVDKIVSKDLVDTQGIGIYTSYMQSTYDVFKNLKSDKKNSEKIFLIDKALRKWKKTYVSKSLSSDFFSSKNIQKKYDNKIITFDLILADALHEGPLLKKGVYIPKHAIKNLYDIFDVKYGKFIFEFLMMSCVYKIEKLKNNREYQLTNLAVFSNWRNKKNFHRDYEKFKEILEGKRLMGVETIHRNTTRLFIDDTLIEEYMVEEVDFNSGFTDMDNYLLFDDSNDYEVIEKEIKKIYTDEYKKNRS